jgi:hypothetical protein
LLEEQQLARRRNAYDEVLACGLYDDLSKVELQLLKQCLQADITARPSIKELMKSAYFLPRAGPGQAGLGALFLGAVA